MFPMKDMEMIIGLPDILRSYLDIYIDMLKRARATLEETDHTQGQVSRHLLTLEYGLR